MGIDCWPPSNNNKDNNIKGDIDGGISVTYNHPLTFERNPEATSHPVRSTVNNWMHAIMDHCLIFFLKCFATNTFMNPAN